MSLEPNACLSLWPTEECEWSTWDIWRSSDIVEHVIYVILALMLGYTFFVFIRFLVPYHSARHELRHFGSGSGDANLRSRRRLAVLFGSGLGTLKAIGSGAPFLGLAGTCYGIMGGAFMGFNMEKHAAMRMLMMNIASSLSTAAAGIVAAIPATLSHNFIRTRIEVLRAECPVSRTAFPMSPLSERDRFDSPKRFL